MTNYLYLELGTDVHMSENVMSICHVMTRHLYLEPGNNINPGVNLMNNMCHVMTNYI